MGLFGFVRSHYKEILVPDNTEKERHLRGHERKLIIDPALDDLGVDDEAGSHIVQKNETGIGGQVKLRDADTADGTVIQRPLEPLSRVCIQSILRKVLQVTAE